MGDDVQQWATTGGCPYVRTILHPAQRYLRLAVIYINKKIIFLKKTLNLLPKPSYNNIGEEPISELKLSLK